MELLDTGEGNVVDALLGTVLVERGIDLAGAEDDAINLLMRLDGALLGARDRG